MKIISSLILAWVLFTIQVVSANPIDERCPAFVYGGAPVSIRSGIFLCRMNYAVAYRTDTKTAEYVVEHLVKNTSSVSIRRDDFRYDPELPSSVQARIEDYVGSSYDRGHLSPAGDNTASVSIMSESFLLSNIIPQDPHNNRGIWKHLETAIRSYVENNGPVYVVTGTAFAPLFKTIGQNKIGVPTYIWKVVIDDVHRTGIAFIVPNKAVAAGSIAKYAMPISALSDATGIRFMPALPLVETDIITRENGVMIPWFD